MATHPVREYDSTDYIACDDCHLYLLAHEAVDLDGGRYHEGCAEALVLALERAADEQREDAAQPTMTELG